MGRYDLIDKGELRGSYFQGASNKGSSGLVYYLEKKNKLDHKQWPEYWFNGQQIRIEPYEVMRKIECNFAKLGKTMLNSTWSI